MVEPAPESSTVHPVSRLDDVVHQRYRLAILAFLKDIERAEFTALRSALALTDGNLNRHLAALAGAGLVEIDKQTTSERRARTWIRMTATGRTAYTSHVAALLQMLDLDTASAMRKRPRR